MASSIAQKLRITEDMKLLTINAPSDFLKDLQPTPKNLQLSSKTKDYDQIHWFVKNSSEIEKDLKKVVGLIKENVICWIYYPKGTSGMQTDLTRDNGWDNLLKYDQLQWISLISFNDTWSTFGMRLKTEADKKRESKPKERPIFEYLDLKNRIVHPPVDLDKEIRKSKKAQAFFDSLSFTNKKEYVEWVVTAKREETRKERIKGTVERLEKNWKNPRNI